MTSPSSLSVVIPAAGIGSRMASDIPKQYLSLAGKTILEHAINAFVDHPLIQKIVVCLHPKDSHFNTLSIANHPKVITVEGGETRAQSVLNGLRFLQEHMSADWVLVHDAARPGLSQKALDRLLAAQKYSGAILALPVVDTIKAAESESEALPKRILTTIDRSHLWLAQTPQMFQSHRLLHAIEHALSQGVVLTDEASAIEYLGDDVLLIEGEAANMKITRPEDLALAEFYLRQQTIAREH